MAQGDIYIYMPGLKKKTTRTYNISCSVPGYISFTMINFIKIHTGIKRFRKKFIWITVGINKQWSE